ncbi:MAG: YfcE family phosphodiesterase [Spirochaetaceae bacterium]|nr:YfcE family phosphodiesterase [Spirochaetaceae bacterium]
MNSFSVPESSIIGSAEDMDLLEKKKSAKLLVISDSHGDVQVFAKIIHEFGADCDAIVFCGDGICDLVSCLNEAATEEKIASLLPPVIVCVRGNGDGEQYPADFFSDGNTSQESSSVPRYFNVLSTVMFRAAGRTLLCVHGNRHGVDFGTETLSATAETMDCDIVLFGHTHRPHREDAGATLVLNPGSCSRPRGGFPPTFAIISFPGKTERYHVDFFEIRETLFGGYSFSPFYV